MKRFILAAALIAAMILGLCFTASAADTEELSYVTVDDSVDYPDAPPALESGATEIVVTEPTEAPTTEAPTTEVTVPVTTGPINIEIPTTNAPTGSGTVEEDKTMQLTELAYRIWEENKEIIFSAISALFSLIVWVLTSKRYIPKIYAGMKNLMDKQAVQKTDIDGFREESGKRLDAFDKKLSEFEQYDEVARDMKKVLAECRLDRQVLIKVIEMQAEELNHIIEVSGLPQVRKDQLYAEYKAQLLEVQKLKGDNADGEKTDNR